MHGGMCWAFSMLIGALLALGAARTAAESTAMIASGPRAQAKAQREGNVRERNGGPTVQDRNRASDAADTAATTSGAAAGGAFLALIAALVGAMAAARSSKRALTEEFHFSRTNQKATGRPAETKESSRTDDSLHSPV